MIFLSLSKEREVGPVQRCFDGQSLESLLDSDILLSFHCQLSIVTLGGQKRRMGRTGRSWSATWTMASLRWGVVADVPDFSEGRGLTDSQ